MPIIDVVNRIFKTNESVIEFSQNCPEIHLIKEVETSEASFQSVLIVLQILNRVHQFWHDNLLILLQADKTFYSQKILS